MKDDERDADGILKGLLAAIVTSATDTSNVNSAVSGYMAFILYSVAGLACASPSFVQAF